MSEVMSQDEVNALLRGVTDGNVEVESEELIDVSGVVAYDLTSQERIIRGRMPTLDIINQRFSRFCRKTFCELLQQTVNVSAVSIDTIKFGEFIKSLPVPSCINVCKIPPLNGYILVISENKLVYSLVDTAFNGPGNIGMKIRGRDFTDIELGINNYFIHELVKDLNKAWKPVEEINLEVIKTEVNPQFAVIVPPTDIVVCVIFEIEVDQFSGSVTLCYPYSTLEPIINKLRKGFQSESIESNAKKLTKLINKVVPFNLKAEIGTIKIDYPTLKNLKVGQEFAFEKRSNNGVLKVSNVPLTSFNLIKSDNKNEYKQIKLSKPLTKYYENS